MWNKCRVGRHVCRGLTELFSLQEGAGNKDLLGEDEESDSLLLC